MLGFIGVSPFTDGGLRMRKGASLLWVTGIVVFLVSVHTQARPSCTVGMKGHGCPQEGGPESKIWETGQLCLGV